MIPFSSINFHSYSYRIYFKCVIVVLLFGLLFLCGWHLDIRPFKIIPGMKNLFTLLNDAFPPDMSLFSVSLKAVAETLQIAYMGTLLGLALSLPFGILGARNLFSKRVTIPVRVFLGAIRTMPSLLWAVVFVIMIGLGPFAGVLATVMYTTGYLGKLQYEAIEGINPEPLEAMSGMGASKFQLIRFVVIPESANHLISQALFMFEYNVRASTILGFVGAGGIGFYISAYLRYLEYDKVFMLILIVFVTVLIIDYISLKIRDRYLMIK